MTMKCLDPPNMCVLICNFFKGKRGNDNYVACTQKTGGMPPAECGEVSQVNEAKVPSTWRILTALRNAWTFVASVVKRNKVRSTIFAWLQPYELCRVVTVDSPIRLVITIPVGLRSSTWIA